MLYFRLPFIMDSCLPMETGLYDDQFKILNLDVGRTVLFFSFLVCYLFCGTLSVCFIPLGLSLAPVLFLLSELVILVVQHC